MEPTKTYVVLLVIFSVIDSSFSAIFFNYVYISPRDHYVSSRDSNVHRGLLLSLSPAQKYQMCLDIFSWKFTPRIKLIVTLSVLSANESRQMKVTDGWLNWGDPVHPVSVKPIRVFMGGIYRPANEDLFFKCVLKNYPGGLPLNESEYYVSSAYHPNLMFDGFVFNEWEQPNKVTMRRYILLSPKFVSIAPIDLERHYVTTRQTLKYLGEESPKYVDLIEKRDTISTLSTWQMFLLCSSIISSPIHELDRHQFDIKWLEFRQNAEREHYSKYENLQISFRNADYDREKWMANCVHCKSSSESGDVFSGTTTNLLVTRDFTDQNSAYVLTEEFGAIFISEYIKNVPILMNAHVPATNEAPYIFPH